MLHGKGQHNWIPWCPYLRFSFVGEKRSWWGIRLLCCEYRALVPREHRVQIQCFQSLCVCVAGVVCAHWGPGTTALATQLIGEVPFSSEVEGKRERNVGFLLVHSPSYPVDGGIFPWREHQGQPLSKCFTSRMWQEIATKWSGTRGVAENIKERQREEGQEASPFGRSHKERH